MLQRIKRKIPLLLVIGSLILTACATPIDGAQTPTESQPPAETSTESPAPTLELEGTAWSLESIGETPVISDSRLTLIFEAGGQAGGLGGCNSYGASYQIEGDSIAFEPITSTLMACEPSEIMEQEAEFFAALGAASSFELTEDRLIIHFDDGQGALYFVPAEAEDVEREPTADPDRTEPAAGETPELITERLCDPVSDPSMPAWTGCHSHRFGFEVFYPQAAELTDQTAATVRFDLPFTEDTNLTEKYMEVAVVEGADDCTSPMAAGSPPESILVEPVEIEGLSFLRQVGMGAAAGNRYDWLAYSTEQGDRCVSLGFVLHSFPPELMPTPPPTYDVEVEAAVFEEIVKTFRWVEPSESEGAEPDAERIVFGSWKTSAVLGGSLPVSGADIYVIRALQGQTMTVDLSFTRGRAILAVWGADGTVLMSDHAEAARFSQELPATQDYFIQLKGSPESDTDYQMTVTIPPLSQSGGEVPTAERITFAAGGISAAVTGNLAVSGSDLYVIRALEDQTMTIDLTFERGRAILAVWGADGTVLLSDHAEASRFSQVLPATQDYFIHLKGSPESVTDYRMTVSVPPASGQPGDDTPVAERITFERGKTAAERSGSLPAAGSDLYVINAMQGQTMTVDLSFTAGQAILAVWGADGTVLMSDHAEASHFSGVLPATQDYYVHLKGHPEQATDYHLTVTIPPLGQ